MPQWWKESGQLGAVIGGTILGMSLCQRLLALWRFVCGIIRGEGVLRVGEGATVKEAPTASGGAVRG